jgi:acyl CoA:acetate/3-ketoacid CoA transferase
MSRVEQIEAYVMPSGVTMQLLRETAAKRPGKTRLIHKLDQHKASTCPLI